jgi:hypothetical protein
VAIATASAAAPSTRARGCVAQAAIAAPAAPSIAQASET